MTPRYLDGGADGTKYLAEVIEQSTKYLRKPNGRLYVNFGSTSNPKKLFHLLDQKYEWKELARIHIPFSEQFIEILDYLTILRRQRKAEFWNVNGVPFRWYAVIEAKLK